MKKYLIVSLLIVGLISIIFFNVFSNSSVPVNRDHLISQFEDAGIDISQILFFKKIPPELTYTHDNLENSEDYFIYRESWKNITNNDLEMILGIQASFFKNVNSDEFDSKFNNFKKIKIIDVTGYYSSYIQQNNEKDEYMLLESIQFVKNGITYSISCSTRHDKYPKVNYRKFKSLIEKNIGFLDKDI